MTSRVTITFKAVPITHRLYGLAITAFIVATWIILSANLQRLAELLGTTRAGIFGALWGRNLASYWAVNLADALLWRSRAFIDPVG